MPRPVGGVLRCLLASAHQEEAVFVRVGVELEHRQTGVTSARLTVAKAPDDALVGTGGVKDLGRSAVAEPMQDPVQLRTPRVDLAAGRSHWRATASSKPNPKIGSEFWAF